MVSWKIPKVKWMRTRGTPMTQETPCGESIFGNFACRNGEASLYISWMIWGSTHFRRPNRGYLQTLGMRCGLASYSSACFPSRKEDRSPSIERSPLFHPDVIRERRVVGVLYWVSINWISRVSPHELQICKQIFAVNNSDKNFGQHPSCFSPSFMRNSLRDDPVDHAMHSQRYTW